MTATGVVNAPLMDPSKVMAGLTRETNIRRDARGRWFNCDDPIDHPLVVRAFDGWIDRAEDGRLCLSNDINWAYIEVEGPPYVVRGVAAEGADLTLLLSGDLRAPLDPATLRQGPDGALYCDVRNGRLPARFDRYAATQLVDLIGGEDDQGPYLDLGGRVRPPVVDDPLQPVGGAGR
jgi:uncharacterized protein